MKYLKLFNPVSDPDSLYQLKLFYPGILYVPADENLIGYLRRPQNVFFILFDFTESGHTIEGVINGEATQFQKTQNMDGKWIYYVKIPPQDDNILSLCSFNKINSDGSKTPLYAGFQKHYYEGSSSLGFSIPMKSSLDEKLFKDSGYYTALISQILKTGSSDERYEEVVALLEEKHIKTKNHSDYLSWFIGGDTPIDFCNIMYDAYKVIVPSMLDDLVNSYAIIGISKYDMIASVLIST